MQKIIILVFLASFMVSCDFSLKEEENREPIARVNNSYLYKDDVSELISEASTKEDSAVLVQNYINNWATKQLFLDGALVNLSEEKQAGFDKLVKQYKTDLYTKAYIEALVSRNLDTVVNRSMAEAYYDKNKDVFKLNEELLQFRYIHVDENIIDYSGIEKKFKRFNKTDKRELDSMSIQFKSYSLNDTIWIKASQVISKIPAITPENKNQLLKKSNFVQLKDSLGVYLMQINDVLLRNDTAPLEFVTPTINQIVRNRRKLELIKKLEKDITKDAIKNKEFEIYK